MTHGHAHTHASDTHPRATWLLTQRTHTHSIIVNRGACAPVLDRDACYHAYSSMTPKKYPQPTKILNPNTYIRSQMNLWQTV